jgi:hypothetical protein
MAELYTRLETVDDDEKEKGFCVEKVEGILFDLPRDGLLFEDRLYTRDNHQIWSFRHPIGIPEDLLPVIWKKP